MKTQSTYSLLVSSQEKGRTLFEAAVYGLVMLSTIVSVFHFAAQPMVLPTHAGITSPTTSAIAAQANTQHTVGQS